MNQWFIMAFLSFAGLAFAVGGTGYKWVRRFILPFGLIIGWLLLNGFSLVDWQIWACASALCAVLHLGYGEGRTWLVRFLIGASYGATVLFLGWTHWLWLYPLVFVGLFWLSNQPWSERDFVWKVCEFFFGAGIGAAYVGVLGHLW